MSVSLPTVAQQSYVVTSDTSLVTVDRSIPQSKIDEYRSQPEYNYDENPDYEESFLGTLWMRFRNWLKSVLGQDGYGALGSILFYGLLLFGLVWFIMFVLRAQGHNPFSRGNRKSEIAVAAEDIDENSSIDSIEDLVHKAEISGDYRLAIRLQYLKLLRLLDSAEEIEWRSGKTNYDYLNEIKGLELKEDFDALNYIYEYSWYGQFDISSEEKYRELRAPFYTLFDQLKVKS